MKRFFQKLFKPLKKRVKANKGFTLLEILVVLTIMGFLIAMVAPRLAGVSSGAVDTVCDSNQNRMVSMMSAYFEKTNRFPSKMTNLVVETGTGINYSIPTISDDDPDNGPETIASEFNSRNNLSIHILNLAEATELKELGIAKLLNLNSYDNSGVAAADQEAFMREVPPGAGVGVAMIGTGVNALTGDTFTAPAKERGWGEPDWYGRIVLGFGPENGLVTSGLIANAAHCPGGIQNADNVTYNDYNLILPRLQATSDRMWVDGATPVNNLTSVTDNDAITEGVQLRYVVAYNDDPGTGYNITTNNDKLKVRAGITITEAQEPYQYATMCPEGHKFPADDEEFWGIDFDNGADLD